jgi:hypothetical protein
MHSRNSGKPIGKCKGCPLNLKKRCAVFSNPFEMWQKGKCRGYGDEALLAEHVAAQAAVDAKQAKAARRETARRRKTEPHHDGLANPGGARW